MMDLTGNSSDSDISVDKKPSSLSNATSSRKRTNSQRNERELFVAGAPPERNTKSKSTKVVRKFDASKINFFETKSRAAPTNAADDEFDIDEADPNEIFSGSSSSIEYDNTKKRMRKNKKQETVAFDFKKFQQECEKKFAAHGSGGIHQEQKHATSVKRGFFKFAESNISGSRPSATTAAGSALTTDSNLTQAEINRMYKKRNLQRGAITDYFQKYQTANADKSDAECRAHAVEHFTKQGYCPELVLQAVQQRLDNNMQPKKRAASAAREQLTNDVREKFHEYVQMVCDGDLSQISLKKFAESIDINLNSVTHILQNDEFIQRMRQIRKDDDVLFEARRSIIISKFVEFSGDLRERRNACVRHFWKTPHYTSKAIMLACNRFVKFGTVRTNDKNKATEWVGNDKKRLRGEISPAEAEFVQALNTERAQLACNFRSGAQQKQTAQKKKKKLATTSASKASNSNDDDDDDDEGGEITDGKEDDIVAALKASNEALKRELQEAKNSLVMLQLSLQQQQQQFVLNETNSSTKTVEYCKV